VYINDTVKRVHVLIKGKVQGVGFRASTRRRAKNLELAGWVKNLDSGEVEAVFEGSKESINEMLDWCKKGPSLAKVVDVKVEDEEPEVLESFEVKR
jgi:acylphosphatase